MRTPVKSTYFIEIRIEASSKEAAASFLQHALLMNSSGTVETKEGSLRIDLSETHDRACEHNWVAIMHPRPNGDTHYCVKCGDPGKAVGAK